MRDERNAWPVHLLVGHAALAPGRCIHHVRQTSLEYGTFNLRVFEAAKCEIRACPSFDLRRICTLSSGYGCGRQQGGRA